MVVEGTINMGICLISYVEMEFKNLLLKSACLLSQYLQMKRMKWKKQLTDHGKSRKQNSLD